MIRRPVHAVWLPSAVDACALWRMYMPYQNTPGSSFFSFINPVFPVIVDNDVAIVQRCYSQPQFRFINACKKASMRVIMDLDDDVWHVPESNPAAKMLHAVKDGFSACMQVVDLVTVSTKQLASIAREQLRKAAGRNSRVEIIVAENRIDEKLFAAPCRRDQLVVGWAGSSSHMGIVGRKRTGDLGLIEDTLLELAPQHADVVFQFRGGHPVPELLHAPNVEYKAWAPVAEYPARMPRWGWSIALAPLMNVQFNCCKSSIKMVEAGYCGIPCLASHVEPYERFVSHDRELRWLLCSKEHDWTVKLRELIHDSARREELGARMKKVTSEYYAFNRPHEGWQRALRAVT